MKDAMDEAAGEISQDVHRGIVRSDMSCHNCSKTFLAELNYDIDGDYIIECPHCLHEHCRTVKDGKVTEHRWSSREQRKDVATKVSVWKHSVLQIKTSSTAEWLRHRWLNREDRATQ